MAGSSGVRRVLIPFESGHWIGVDRFVDSSCSWVLIPFESGHWIGVDPIHIEVKGSLNPF